MYLHRFSTHVLFLCQVPTQSLDVNLQSVPVPSSLVTWSLLKSAGQVSVEHPSILICQMFSQDLIEVTASHGRGGGGHDINMTNHWSG